jgi:hypothetical protein
MVIPISQRFSAKLVVRRAMMCAMSETPEHPSETAAAESPSRWDKSHRRGGLFRLMAFFVTLAAIVFIFAAIFWSGFVLGSEGGDGGGEHEHGGRESSQETGGSPQENGMNRYGLPMEQTDPSLSSFAG